MRALGAAAAGAVLALGGALCGCSLALDFDAECEVDADCEAVGPGLRCATGYCVKRDLLQAAGPCDTILGEDPRLAEPDAVLLFGAIFPQSGALSTVGPGMRNGVELAVQEINQIGGVLGRKIGVLACDSGTSASQAVVAASHLVDVAQVEAIIGAGASGVTIDAFSQVAKARGVLMLSPSATSPAISDLPDDGLLWRIAPSDAIQGKAIAGLLLNDLSAERVAVVSRDDAYGNGLALVIQQELCRTVACSADSFRAEIYPGDPDDPTFAATQDAIVGRLEAWGPDVVVLVAFGADGLAFLQRAEGKGFSFVLTDGTRSTSLMPALGDRELLCGIVGTNPGAPDPEHFHPFEVKYGARFGRTPATYAAQAYDAAYALGFAWAATQGAGIAPEAVDGRAIAKGMTRLSAGVAIGVGLDGWGQGVAELSSSATATIDVEGISGSLDFDAAVGEAPAAIELWRFDLDATSEDATIEELGVVLDDAGAYIPGRLTARPDNHSCRTGR